MGVISNALWKLRYAATCPVAIDYLNPAVEGKNLREKNIAVRGGTTTHAVAFTGQHSAENAQIARATAAQAMMFTVRPVA